MDVTGAPRQTAEHFLEMAAGDLEAAVAFYLDFNGTGANHRPQEQHGPSQDLETRAPILASRGTLAAGFDDFYEEDEDLDFEPEEPFAVVGIAPTRHIHTDMYGHASPQTPELNHSLENRFSPLEPPSRLETMYRAPLEILFAGTFEQVSVF